MKPSKKRRNRGFFPVLLAFIRNSFNKKLAIITISAILLIASGFVCIRYLENKAFQSRVSMKELRSFITYVIQDELNKAVDLGIIGFNLVDGVIIEDLVISQEEDFSNSKKLLHSKKVALKLSSIFSSKPYIKKIQFIKTKISIDIDGPFFSKFIDYLNKINIQEVEFIDSEIEIMQGDKVILNWSKKTHWNFKQTDNIISFEFDNGYYFIPILQRIQGRGTIELLEDKLPAIGLQSKWKNIQVEEFPGLIDYLSAISPSSGKMNGSFSITTEEDNLKLTNEMDYSGLNGYFSFLDWEDFQDYDLHVVTHAEINRESDSTKLTQLYSTEAANWSWTWEVKKDLRNGNASWDIKDLSKVIQNFPELHDIELTGSLNGDLSWEETGNRTKWFIFNLDNYWKNGKWEQEGWKIESESFHSRIENNRWKNKFNGKLFDSDFSLESDIQLQFWRSLKPDKSVYYPMGTTGSISGNISEIRVVDWSHFYKKIKSIIEKDIQERKEKLILKDYFTEFKIYRYLLEDMNVDWNIDIENAITSSQGNKLKDWIWKGFIKKGVTRIEMVQNKTSNRIEFNTKFATKLPYMDFRLNLKDIPWDRNFGKICGIDFVLDSWSQDFRFRGTGADSYNISKSASITGELEWKGIQLQDTEENIKRKIPIPELNWTEKFDLTMDLSHYGEVSYYRGMEIIFDENRYLKGSGSFKNDSNLFSFYGKSGQSILKYNLIENEKFCK